MVREREEGGNREREGCVIREREEGGNRERGVCGKGERGGW